MRLVGHCVRHPTVGKQTDTAGTNPKAQLGRERDAPPTQTQCNVTAELANTAELKTLLLDRRVWRAVILEPRQVCALSHHIASNHVLIEIQTLCKCHNVFPLI